MIISISGWAGTGKSTTATKLADVLGYHYYSGGSLFRAFAKEQDIDLLALEEQARIDPSFDKDLDAYQAKLGTEKDAFVIESRLGWYFIPHAVSVKLACDDEVRFKRISQRENKTVEQIKAETLERETAITDRYWNYYKIRDFMDDDNFDLVIDTAHHDIEATVRLIIDYLENNGQK